MAVKIGIIGAGSANYVVSVVKDICLTPRLKGSTISFMDVDRVKLDTAFELCRRYAAEMGATLNLEKTTSRRACLRGADFVIHTALATGGSHEQLQAGWRIAERYGYRFAGSAHVMYDEAFWVNFHQLRLMDAIVEDMLEICPKTWLLLVANPVFAGTTWLRRRYPKAKVVGLCHGFAGVYGVAWQLGLRDFSKIDFEIPGINHFVWLNRFTYKGKNAFPVLDRWIARKAKRFWSGKAYRIGWEPSPKKTDLYRKFGAYPVGDTASPAGYAWPFWYNDTPATERKWKEDARAFWTGHFQYCRDQLPHIARLLRKKSVRLREAYGDEHTGEVMIPLIDSLSGGPARKLVVNVLNDRDYVPGIPRDIAVEIKARCGRRGIEGIRHAPMPAPLLTYLLRDRVAPANMELLAYEKRDRNLLLNLIMMDPWSKSIRQARRMMEEVMAMPGQRGMREFYQ